MNKSAILHIPLSQYAFAEDEHSITIRLRTQKNDIDRCFVFYGDRVDPNDPIAVKQIPMEKVASDDLFDYYETTVRDIFTRICYYFLLEDETEKEYYYERNFCQQMQCSRTEYFQFPYIRREDIISIPDWAQNIVMYHIFPDSFASSFQGISGIAQKIGLSAGRISETHLGGTLTGVMDNLDYLKNLGINCIYLNPIFTANSYHKYDTIDYFDIDPCFGNKEIFRKFVKQCHENGIRVILDGVFNHCGPDFFAFLDVRKKGKRSRYYDWFYYMPEPVEYTDPPSYEAFAYVKEMPKLNTGNPEVAEYLCMVGTYWIKEADIDGWRLDVANEINHDFWRRFRDAVRSEKEDIFLIGEIWEDAGCWLMGDQFDSTMNYTFSYLSRDFFAERSMGVREFDEQIQRMIMRYPRKVSLAQMNFLDSHDVPRFLSYCAGDRRRMELAFFYLILGPGIPSIFYGDECYMEGTTEPEYRAAMPWSTSDTCYEKIKTWIDIRRKYAAIRNGSYRTVYTDCVQNCYAFLRSDEDQNLLVVLNNSDQPVEIACRLLQDGKLFDVTEQKEAGQTICLAAMEGKVFLSEIEEMKR